jgi:hypothetical protein
MFLSSVGLGTKNRCAGEGQQQFNVSQSVSLKVSVCVCVSQGQLVSECIIPSRVDVASCSQVSPLVGDKALFRNT